MDKNELNHQKWLNWSNKGYIDIMYWVITVLIIFSIALVGLVLFGDKKVKISQLLPMVAPFLAVFFFVLPTVKKYRKKNIHKIKIDE